MNPGSVALLPDQEEATQAQYSNSLENNFSLMGFTSVTHTDYTRCNTIKASVWLCTHVHVYLEQCNDICSCFFK